MKKIINLLGVAAFVLGGATSCTLDAENYVEKSTDNFPATAEDAVQALAGIYQNLNLVSATPQASFLYAAMLASDDCLGGGGPNDLLMQAEDLILNSTEDMTQQFWNDRYQGINRANSLIDGLANIALSEDDKNQIEGEAKFLRAFYYYELASMYGRVPLVLTSAAAEPVQPTAAELWSQILQDLRDAASVMPATRRTDGHVDRYAAEAMLGRAWLFYTGFYGNGDDLSALTSTSYSPLTSVDLPDGSTLTKQDVIGYIDDCVNNSGYKLVDDFRNLWAYTNRCTVEDYEYTAEQGLKWVEDDNGINPESMFAIKFNKLADWSTTIGYANGYALHFGVRSQPSVAESFPFGQGWGAGPVAPNIVNDWKNADPADVRRDASYTDYASLPATELGGGGEFVQESGYYQKKWLPISAKNDELEGGYSVCFENIMYGNEGWPQGAENLQLNNIHDLVLIRFADVLLMQSELKEETTGINLIRKRAGLTALSAYSLQALQNERRWELAFEGIRWNDIRRWHIAAAALEKQTNVKCYYNGTEGTNSPHGGGYTARYNATAGFFKIPESQVSLSNGGIEQNPGWEGAESQYNRW